MTIEHAVRADDLDVSALPAFTTLLADRMASYGDRVAVSDGDRRLTYGELDEATTALAHALRGRGEDLTRPVAILSGHDANVVVGVLGGLRSCRPVVILDPLVPADRLARIVELAGADTIVATAEHLELAGKLGSSRVLTMEDLIEDHRSLAAQPLPVAEPDAVSLILFTSGSTGQPKGVVWNQRLLAAEAMIVADKWEMTTADRVAMALPLSFAFGTLVLVGCLDSGAHICMLDPRSVGSERYAGWLGETGVTSISLTPSLLRSLTGAMPPGATLDALRLVAVGGEALYGSDVEAIRGRGSADLTVLQLLGSTEVAFISFLPIRAADPIPDGSVPVGYSSRWRRLRVVDDAGDEVEPGQPGNLVVTTGLGAEGYWRDEANSAQKFVRRPDGLKDIRTGDVGALDEDGLLRLLGRAEAAVKIRGYLVDPSEIEAALLKLPEIGEAVVLPLQEGNTTVLAAYVAPAPGGGSPSVVRVREHLAGALPSYMVPRHVVVLVALPKNDRGKVDRPNLPPVPPRVVEPPSDERERGLARIWSVVLGLGEVGRNEDFFALGGDSLAVEEVLTRVQSGYGVSLTASDLSQHSRLEVFARLLPEARPEAGGREAAGALDDAPIFCMPGGGSSAAHFGPLLSRLPASAGRFVLVQRGHERRNLIEWNLERIIRRRVREIRRLRPHGPYVVAGHSFGAVVAMGVARALQEAGEEVAAVLLDPYLSETKASERHRPGQLASVRRMALLPLAGLLPMPRTERERFMFVAASRAMRHHVPQPWRGRTFVYRTADNPDPQELWDRLVPEREIDRAFPCDHNSVLRQPYVDEIAHDLERLVSSMAGSRPAF